MNSETVFLSVAVLMQSGEATLQTGPFGTQLKASEYVNDGVPVINVRNIGFGDIKAHNLEYISEPKAEQLHHHILSSGDIVFGRKGAVERHALITNQQNGWVQGSDCLRLRISSDRVDNAYLSYYLRTQTHQEWMQAICSFGATMTSLNQDIVSRIRFPAPSITTQREIAAILIAYDDLIANNQRRITLLEGMAEEIYREWFVRMRFPKHEKTLFEKDLPVSWTYLPLRKIVKYYIGGGWGEDQPSSSHPECACVIRGTDIPRLAVGILGDGLYRYHKSSNSASRFLNEEDFIFEVSGGSKDQLLGRSLMLSQRLLNHFGGRVICASFCKMIRFDCEQVSPYFMRFYLKLYYELGLTGLFQVQSTGISNYQFESFLSQQMITVPNRELMKDFEIFVKPLLEERDILAIANDKLRRIRDSLLPRLISGKLKVSHLDIQFPPSMREDAAA